MEKWRGFLLKDKDCLQNKPKSRVFGYDRSAKRGKRFEIKYEEDSNPNKYSAII